MINIRFSNFETNSSSVHRLIVMPKAIYRDIENGNAFLNYYKSNFPDNIVTKTFDEFKEEYINKHDVDPEDVYEEDVVTYALTNGYMTFNSDYDDEYAEVLTCEVGEYMTISYYNND